MPSPNSSIAARVRTRTSHTDVCGYRHITVHGDMPAFFGIGSGPHGLYLRRKDVKRGGTRSTKKDNTP
jgi:hypothetical protein